MNCIQTNSFSVASGTTPEQARFDYGAEWRRMALQSVAVRKRRLNWDKVMGLCVMAGVSAAGWTAAGMVISRLLR
ncbi:MAG: hypothetical protein LAN83_18830 [Acidobacteriia bacterium]|nr:hypothetical protein [Terriglobia bacterium]